LALWFGVDLVRNGPDVHDRGFFWRQVAMLTTEDAGHGGFFGYHFVVLLLGCFPASVFAVQELLSTPADPSVNETLQNDHRRWMVILFWVVLDPLQPGEDQDRPLQQPLLFPAHLPGRLATGTHLGAEAVKPSGGRASLLGGLGTLIALVFIVVPFLGMRIELIKPLFADRIPSRQANLDAAVHWTGSGSARGLAPAWVC
jgi:hypothetical protein